MILALKLFIYPALQLIFFLFSVGLFQREQVVLAIFSSLIAGFFGTWTLFVSIHELVHRRLFENRFAIEAAEIIFTLFIGQPYNGYKASHFAHHHYVNTLEDETSTYFRGKNGEAQSQGVIRYAFGWPYQFFKSLVFQPPKDSYLFKMRQKHTPRFLKDLFFLTIFLIGLFKYSAGVLALYCLMFYLAWAGMAVLNYAQHPPIEYGKGLTTSYYGKLYNLLFLNNGFHFEHHQDMQKDPLKTSKGNGAWEIKTAPLIAPFVEQGFLRNDTE